MRVHVGAYPTYGPADSAEAATVVSLLAESPLVAGLEVPFAGGRLLLPAARMPSDWRHVVTLIPETMTALTVDPAWGPASPDPAGRAAAVELLRSVRDLVSARTDVAAVELQSAPKRTGSAAVFAESLAEVASWDWGGVDLVVEHCDAWTQAHPVEKGFLSFADELDAIAGLPSGTRVTAGVNWARSVIETRDASTAAEHVRTAAARGLLGAVMFSSVAGVETEIAAPWRDVHLAPIGVPGAPDGSLLTPELIAETRRASGAHDGAYDGILGLKVNLGPSVRTPAEQAAGLLDMAALVGA